MLAFCLQWPRSGANGQPPLAIKRVDHRLTVLRGHVDQHQWIVSRAWFDGLSDWWEDQDIAGLATGTNESNCWSRYDNMTWQNIGSYPFIRDGSIGYMCLEWMSDQ